MPCHEGLAALLREALQDAPDLTGKRMFGGLCFLSRRNMMCGMHKGGGMTRVGQAAGAEACATPGVSPLGFSAPDGRYGRCDQGHNRRRRPARAQPGPGVRPCERPSAEVAKARKAL